MELFAQYQKERVNRETLIVPDKGFATYQISKDDCYIVDIFVKTEFRKTKLGSEMANEITKIAKQNGCTTISGTVDLRANGAEVSTLSLLHYGFKLVGAVDHIISFRKQI